MQFRVYNTGDRIWVSKRYGKEEVVKIITNDGLIWEEGDTGLRKLVGAEKISHQVETFFIKTILRVLSA